MLIFTLLFTLLYSEVNSARILGWFVCPSISHQSVFQPIWRELSLRGHEVTVITSDPLNDPTLKNLTEIDVKFSYKLWKEIDISHMRREIRSAFEIEYYYQKLSKEQ
ncbi:hypothetical protein HHI36_002731 [Cryptolaemus montrouzieri]|uniref:Uncharacterized protein n=1 Tax=Cryptolaemus montrouzieri TaxID=559131 RepID=A0ABD2PBI6_9CUCU